LFLSRLFPKAMSYGKCYNFHPRSSRNTRLSHLVCDYIFFMWMIILWMP
jgi:hypothetical protein